MSAKVPPQQRSPLWLHELKYDGYRLMVRRALKGVRIRSRLGYDWTNRFPLIVDAASRLRGTFENGTLAGELFKMLARVDVLHVPFRGKAPALTALLGGQVDFLFPTLPSSIAYIKSGQ